MIAGSVGAAKKHAPQATALFCCSRTHFLQSKREEKVKLCKSFFDEAQFPALGPSRQANSGWSWKQTFRSGEHLLKRPAVLRSPEALLAGRSSGFFPLQRQRGPAPLSGEGKSLSAIFPWKWEDCRRNAVYACCMLWDRCAMRQRKGPTSTDVGLFRSLFEENIPQAKSVSLRLGDSPCPMRPGSCFLLLYSPRKAGFRFSRKAVTPSLKSAVSTPLHCRGSSTSCR